MNEIPKDRAWLRYCIFTQMYTALAFLWEGFTVYLNRVGTETGQANKTVIAENLLALYFTGGTN